MNDEWSKRAAVSCRWCPPACKKPADAPPPVRDEDNPVMKLPEACADKDGRVSLTFDIAKFTDAGSWT